jgi:hypothetical protein
MVNQAFVESKVSYGFAKAASKLGAACGWFRASSSSNPLAATNQLGMLYAYFRLPSGPFTTPVQFEKFAYLGTFDLTGGGVSGGVQPFDFLVEPVQGCYYVASIDPISYPLCIRTNTVITITRAMPPNPSSEFYSGDLPSSEVSIL